MKRQITDLVDIGNTYMANQQYNRATSSFRMALQRYARSRRGNPVTVPSGFVPANESSILRNEHAPEPLKELRAALVGKGDEGAAGPGYVATYSIPGSSQWLISLHDRTKLLPFDEDGSDGMIPTGSPRAFLVSPGESATLEILALSDKQTQMFAYLIAHLTWARITQLINIYYVRQIFEHHGVPAVMELAGDFQVALALSPRYSWAIARLADVHRIIANGWHGLDTDNTNTSEDRIRRYMTALCLFDHSIRLDDGLNSFWPCAHFGATVVNARGFVGRNPTVSASLESMLTSYDFGFGLAVDPTDQYRKLFDLAVERLAKAQEDRGNYYPWAQSYYAFAIMLRSIKGSSQGMLSSTEGLLTTTNLLESAWLQNTISTRGFEPGELYVNAYFQFGLYLFWRNNLQDAWSLVVMGLQRCFNFNFIPGVEIAAGLQILAVMSAQTMCSAPVGEHVPTIGTEMSTMAIETEGVTVPHNPILDPDDLVKFIRETFDGPITTSVMPFLRPTWVANSVIKMGLQCAVSLLVQYIKILEFLHKHMTMRTADSLGLIDEMKKLIVLLLEKLGSRQHQGGKSIGNMDPGKLPPLGEFELLDFYDSAISILNVGTGTYGESSFLSELLGRK